MLALCSTLLSSAKTYNIDFASEQGLTNAGLQSYISDYGTTDANNGKYYYTNTPIDNTPHGTDIRLTFTNFTIQSRFKYNYRTERYEAIPFTFFSNYPNQGIIKIDAPEGEVITKLTLINSKATANIDDFSRMEAEGFDIKEGNTLEIADGVESIKIMSRFISDNQYKKNFLDGLTVETKVSETATAKEIESSDAIFNGTLKRGDKVKFTCELIAVYQNGQYAYVTSYDGRHPAQSVKGVRRDRDVHEGRNLYVVGNLNTTLSRDDIIAAGVSGTLTETDGTLALIPDADSFTKSDSTNAYPIKAKFITAATLADCNIGDFVCNLDADFKQDGDNWTATDADNGTMPIVNRYMQLQAITAAQFLGFVVDSNGTKAVAPILLDVSTSVADIAVSGIHIATTPGHISIYGNCGSTAIYSTTGTLIAKNQTEINCPTGVYIVVTDGAAHKVSVK